MNKFEKKMYLQPMAEIYTLAADRKVHAPSDIYLL